MLSVSTLNYSSLEGVVLLFVFMLHAPEVPHVLAE